MVEIVFYVSIVFFAYTYLGYPLLIFIAALFFKRGIQRTQIYPSVAVIIPVHNEASSIKLKIDNCLKFDYPADKIEIIVISDCSDDDPEKIVKSFSSDRVIFREISFRGGKVAAQNFATRYCQAEIIVYTDVAISTDPDSIKLIVQKYSLQPNYGIQIMVMIIH